ncbi:MAG: hypothetical protein ACK5V3_03120 [Bdellovibrionales bacterium]
MQVAGKSSNICAITNDQSVYCMGLTDSGLLGSEPLAYSTVPVIIELR